MDSDCNTTPHTVLERGARSMVEDAVMGELAQASQERWTSSSAHGHVCASPLALTTTDTTWTLPDVLPLGELAWPDSLLDIWRTVRYCSLVGTFTELARVWFTVDNKLVLWDYKEGREFCVYDEITELITCVGVPVRPCAGVFEPHVRYVLPVATATCVHLIGLSVLDEQRLAEVRLAGLGYCVATDGALLTRIAGVVEAGRIFAAATDGNVYELKYTAQSTPLVPRMRLVCYSYLFSSTPVLGQLMAVVNTVRQTWLGPRAGLRDLVVDADREIVIVLDERSTITVFRITANGLELEKSLPHQPQTLTRSGSDLRGADAAPLVRLFVTSADQDGCTLIAIALNGDQFRYRHFSIFAGNFRTSLQLRSRTPAHCGPSREVAVCYATDSAVFLAHNTPLSSATRVPPRAGDAEANGDYPRGLDPTAPDELVAVTTPIAIPEPHNTAREVVTTLTAASSSAATPVIRVDAVAKIPDPGRRSAGVLCWQICHPATQYLVVHRDGLGLFMHARPVDTLYMILSAASAGCRDALLRRFAAVYSSADYACMLLQIAAGALNVTTTQDELRMRGNFTLSEGCSRVTTNSATAAAGIAHPSVGPEQLLQSGTTPTLEQLGASLGRGDSSAARRLARELLRGLASPLIEAEALTATGARQVTVQLSPLANAMVLYTARALHGVWDTPLCKLTAAALALSEVALSLALRYLAGLELGCDGGVDEQGDCEEGGGGYGREEQAVRWQRGKFTVNIPPGASGPRATSVARLHAMVLRAAYDLASRALQATTLLRYARFIALATEDRNITFAQLVRDQAVALRLGRYLGRTLLTAPETLDGVLTEPRMQAYMALQRQCPYFFSPGDVQEFVARAEVARLAGSEGLAAFSRSRLAQWVATVAPQAAVYWTSGALFGICRQLHELKKEEVAVELLLHAARQLDPNNACVALYLSERGNGSLTAGSSGSIMGAAASAAAMASIANSNNTSGGGSSGGGGNSFGDVTATLAAYQAKTRVLRLVQSIIEDAWTSHRAAVDRLLGGPQDSGCIWQYEPQDEMTHYWLFDWLAAPRDDASVTQALRQTLVAAQSPLLEKYLMHEAAATAAAGGACYHGELYAQYLCRVKKDYRASVEQSLLLAQSALPDVAASDKLDYRVRRLDEAVACARACGSTQLTQVEQRLRLMQAQRRLYRVVADFLGSHAATLERSWSIDGVHLTEREMAQQHLELLSTAVCSASELLRLGGMYVVFGGAEVQLDVLLASNVIDATVFATCVARAYDAAGLNHAPETTRRLLARYYGPAVDFPLGLVVRELEAHYYTQQPGGSSEAVRLLLDCHVDPRVLFRVYQDLIEAKDAGDEVPSAAFDRANVSGGYLLHSLAIVLLHLSYAARKGTVLQSMLDTAVRLVRNYYRQALTCFVGDTQEREALRQTERVLHTVDNVMHGGDGLIG